VSADSHHGGAAALVRMANQIGEFFDSMPDRPEALAGVAEHIKKFWEPRMRRALLAHVDAGGDADLHRVVSETIVLHRTLLA
jgi:formate dehydrogenase subunit delta